MYPNQYKPLCHRVVHIWFLVRNTLTRIDRANTSDIMSLASKDQHDLLFQTEGAVQMWSNSHKYIVITQNVPYCQNIEVI